MDDQLDTPTEKIDRGEGRQEETPMQYRDTPTEKADRTQPRRRPSRPEPESPMPAAKTEVLHREPPTFAWLVIVTGPQTGEIHRLSADVTSIGRDGSNTIQLDDSYVSRQHAKVRAEEDDDENTHFRLYDLASTTGVFLNGERVYREELADGDRLVLGETELVFRHPSKLVMEDQDND